MCDSPASPESPDDLDPVPDEWELDRAEDRYLRWLGWDDE